MPAIGTCFRACSSSAATEESTPPDMPTMTDGDVMALQADAVSDASQRIVSQRKAMAGEPVVDARQHHGTAKSRRLGGDLLARQPERAHDADVERAIRVMRGAESPPNVKRTNCRARFGVAPLLHAEQAVELDVPAGLFERLAHRGVLQRLVRIKVPGRLVEHDASADVLFDEQKAAVARDDGCDGHMRTPYGLVWPVWPHRWNPDS